MNCLVAKTPRELDICLKLIYAHGYDFFVNLFTNSKGKINYSISVDCESDKFEAIKDVYETLIS